MDAGTPDAATGDAGARDAGADAGALGDDGGFDANLPGDDGGLPDAGLDAGVDGGVDAGLDAGVDAGVDAGFDAGFDAGVDAGFDAGFDAGRDAGFDAGPPSCDSRYGGATGYIYCTETPTECEFFARMDGVRTCTSTCAAFGGTCLRRWRDEDFPGGECVHMDTASRPCGTTGNDTDICVCTRL